MERLKDSKQSSEAEEAQSRHRNKREKKRMSFMCFEDCNQRVKILLFFSGKFEKKDFFDLNSEEFKYFLFIL